MEKAATIPKERLEVSGKWHMLKTPQSNRHVRDMVSSHTQVGENEVYIKGNKV